MKTTLRKVRKSVRSKSGKTFQRSYMVKAQAPKKGRVLASFNHPGPNAGSDHSWLALAIGAMKKTTTPPNESRSDFGSRGAAQSRRGHGESAAWVTLYNASNPGMNPPRSLDTAHGIRSLGARRNTAEFAMDDLANAFGVKRSAVSQHVRRGSFE